MCRLYRIGQTQNVQSVKIVVKKTIDSYLLNMQHEKTEEIQSAIGDDVLKQRKTVKELLDLFGAVRNARGGGFTLVPNHGRPSSEDDGNQDDDWELV